MPDREPQHHIPPQYDSPTFRGTHRLSRNGEDLVAMDGRNFQPYVEHAGKAAANEAVSVMTVKVAPSPGFEHGSQYEADMAFREKFVEKYPEYHEVVNYNLQELMRYAGWNIPNYKFAGADDDGEAIPVDVPKALTDEEGYLKSNGTLLFSRLAVHPVDENDFMPPRDREAYDRQQARHSQWIHGLVPEPVKEMMRGLYELTGAEVVRDDAAAGKPEGFVVRKGVYDGTEIYLNEAYKDGPFVDQDYRHYEIMSPELAEKILLEQ